MTDAEELLRLQVELYEQELSDGDGLVDFASQLALGERFATLVDDPQAFAVIAELMAHAHPHMRRLGSLTLHALPYRWYSLAAPLAEQHLQDGFTWVEYDCVRFFLNNGSLDERIIQLLEAKRASTTKDDVAKIAEKAVAGLRELQAGYREPLVPRESEGLRFSIPASWSLIAQAQGIQVFASPELSSRKLTPRHCRSALKIQAVPNLGQAQIDDMISGNLQLCRTEQVIDLPALRDHADSRALFYRESEVFPELNLREFRGHGSTLLVNNVMSPLSHLDVASARNLAILDSITPL
ncbi:hypothetical protein [Aquipseudomonas ullengensis]|uniref:Uncharacterized protein n=1 Tax=Aquipseudomonas ullengensis TaxID=2759166 RepID=A0A7W4LKH2_9GAMM|nr:hypothetical protein [Pseudomonas ullengensis]MBB2494843.1 hypothetical protein [Pseudomonas ullengensis]